VVVVVLVVVVAPAADTVAPPPRAGDMPFYRNSDIVELKTFTAWRELGFDILDGKRLWRMCSFMAHVIRRLCESVHTRE
jgi:hypothetical protein